MEMMCKYEEPNVQESGELEVLEINNEMEQQSKAMQRLLRKSATFKKKVPLHPQSKNSSGKTSVLISRRGANLKQVGSRQEMLINKLAYGGSVPESTR
jgi:hypothetical protein